VVCEAVALQWVEAEAVCEVVVVAAAAVANPQNTELQKCVAAMR
jgi:hypothetical protein